MRTTVDIDDELLRTARKRAADEQTTLRDVFDRALRQYLARASPKKFNLNWKAHRAGGLQPRVLLEDRSALFDLMDGLPARQTKSFRTQPESLGKCLFPNLDNTSEVLAEAES